MQRRIRFLTGMLACFATAGAPLNAQQRDVARRGGVAAQPAVADSARAPVAKDSAAPRDRDNPQMGRHRLSIATYIGSRLDDNVNRDEIGVQSIGVISGLSSQWVSSMRRPSVVVEYDVAMHRYSATERFNRVSQRLRGTVSRRLHRRWTLELAAEGALKGSSEDRDVADQASVQPRSDFQLTRGTRLRLYGNQRWRLFRSDTLQNAVNQYAGAELRYRFSGGFELEVGGRMEENKARGDRFDHVRRTYTAGFASPLGRRAAVSAEWQYRVQDYSGRFVEIDDVDVPRHDRRFQPEVALEYRLGAFDIELSYEPEYRRSNDPEKEINQNVILFGLRRRW